MASVFRLGTRGSPLALAQAAEVKARLAATFPELAPPDAITIVPIRTSGDRLTQGSLGDAGGKGLFTKEIDAALAAGTIDAAVHSLKDLPSLAPPGLAIACHLPRADPRDALIARGAAGLADLAAGAVIGTASIRRKAQLLHARPDLVVVPLRGNVGTRLAKLEAGGIAATVLAVAGLQRLGRLDAITSVLAPEAMLPAAGQGVIVVEARADDAGTRAFLAALDDAATAACATAERALLATLDGSCQTPIGALATLAGAIVTLDAMVIRPDGGALHRTRHQGPAAAAGAIGAAAGAELAARAGAGFFAAAVPG
ncbi:MAG TPA: hydroxymethylbilane synthase [Stellaceae bacterium]|nr:hydroxymethylbilane synthase [Stellaceae bacterium]